MTDSYPAPFVEASLSASEHEQLAQLYELMDLSQKGVTELLSESLGHLEFLGAEATAWCTTETLYVLAHPLERRLHRAVAKRLDGQMLLLRETNVLCFLTSDGEPLPRINTLMFRRNGFEPVLAIPRTWLWPQQDEGAVFWREQKILDQAQVKNLTPYTGLPSKYVFGPVLAQLIPDHEALAQDLGFPKGHPNPYWLLAHYPSHYRLRLGNDVLQAVDETAGEHTS